MSDRWKLYKKCDDFRVQAPQSVQDIIEIKSIAENGIFEIGTGGVYTKCYTFSDINYATASGEEQEAMLNAWCRWLNTNSEKFKITINNRNRDMDRLENEILFSEMGDNADELRDAYNDIIMRNLREGCQGIEREMYITVRYENARSYEDARNYFDNLEAHMTREFMNLGSVLTPLDARARLKVVHDIFRMGREQSFEFDMDETVRVGYDFKDKVAATHMDFTESDCYFKCDDRYMSALYIRDYPDRLGDTFLTDMMYNNIRMVCTVDVAPIMREDAEKRISELYLGVQQVIRRQNKKRLKAKDFASEISYSVQMDQDEIKDLMDDVRNGNQHLFWTNVVLLVIAGSKQKIRQDTEKLLQYMRNKGVSADYLYCQQREAFNTVLPVGTRQLGTGYVMETKSMPVLYPFRTMELMMPGGVYYGKNRESKNLCIGNRKMLMNGNGIFLGTTGSGKTTQAKNEIMQTLLKTGDDVIVVDPKGDFDKLVSACGGVKVELATTAENFINPLVFYGRNNFVNVANEKAEIVHAIMSVCKKEKLRPEEENVIYKALEAVYSGYITGQTRERTLTDLYQVLGRMSQEEKYNSYEREAALRLQLFLERFVQGPLSIFSHETNTDVRNRLIVFDLSRLGSALWDLGMLVMLEYIQERIQRNYTYENRATWLYIDELHILLAHEEAQKYLLALWKKVRSFGGLCTGITQILGDIEMNNTTKGLLENSEFVSLFKSDVSANQRLVESLGFTPAQIEYITHEVSPGKGLLRFGQTVVPFDMTLPRESVIYKITDTNAHDKFSMEHMQSSQMNSNGI